MFTIVTSRHQSARERRRGTSKKTLNILLCSILKNVAKTGRRATGFEKERKKTFKKVGLVAAQCNDIAACAYSSKNILTGMVLMQLCMVCCIKTSF